MAAFQSRIIFSELTYKSIMNRRDLSYSMAGEISNVVPVTMDDEAQHLGWDSPAPGS